MNLTKQSIKVTIDPKQGTRLFFGDEEIVGFTDLSLEVSEEAIPMLHLSFPIMGDGTRESGIGTEFIDLDGAQDR